MSTLPLQGPKFRAFNANGDPLSGGKLYSYAAGTSTPLDTYTTRAGTIANTNPVILNANGEADVWTATGVLYKFVLKDASDVTQWTVDNVPSGSQESTVQTDLAAAVDPGGRLTLASATPITTTEISGATTVFYVPHKHNKVPLYDGSSWTLYTLATELSQAVSDNTKSPAAGSDGNLYDFFVWYDAGTLRLSRGPAWTSTTSRGTGAGTTELERVGGRYVNKNAISNGAAAQRGLYVGTVVVTGTGVDDTLSRRLIWNNYNRALRPMVATDPGASWTYSTDDWRQAHARDDNRLLFVMGLTEEQVVAEVVGCVLADADSNRGAGVGIGADSATVNSAQILAFPQLDSDTPISGNRVRVFPRAAYQGFPGVGWRALYWLERGVGTDTQTWYGTGTSVPFATLGIWGHLFG